jgi:FtsZ-interacting cell division protein ZipA
MKNKIIIIILIIAVIALAVVIGFYFIQKNKSSINSVENTLLPTQSGASNPTSAEQSQNKLVTDNFEIDLPAGWRQTMPAMGTSAMAVNANEQLNDPAAQKINFRTYFAVSYDNLQEKSLSEYLQGVKNQLRQTISNAVFTQENAVTINDKAARAVEINLTQQGVNYKVLMILVAGKEDDVWVMSFNTIEDSWDEYQETFSSIAKSFSLKK